jgi:cyclopropane-fatty-acyl-phospholipid synthase
MWGIASTRGASIVEKWLERVGIKIDGADPWDVQVHDRRLFRRLLAEGLLGAGESYMDGWWDCPRLDELFYRIVRAQTSQDAHKMPLGAHIISEMVVPMLINLQSRARSTAVAKLHYNLGNSLYKSMLDPYMQYSCGYFHNTEDLATAQLQKLDLICRKLRLEKSDRLLDIGCGWGGLAKYAAERYGCRVVGVNISDSQIEFARKTCAGLPIEILKVDYRDLQGKFDKIVSVGMFEHVGHKNYHKFMDVAHRALKPNGLFLLHCIGVSQVPQGDAWISRYIFPNSELPALTLVAEATAPYFVVEDWHNFGAYYDKTLMAWFRNFDAHWADFESMYGERFYRMWKYFLLSCAGKFRARLFQLWQIVLSRGGVLGGYESVR